MIPSPRVLILILGLLLSSVANGATVPTHEWSQRFGGLGSDNSASVVVDALGNVIVSGTFEDTVNFGGDDLVSAGPSIYLAKFNADGTHQWSKGFGPAVLEAHCAVDPLGNVIVSGGFEGTVNFGGDDLVCEEWAAFLAKFNADGTHQWSKGFELAQQPHCSVDPWGNVIVSGCFSDTVNFGGGYLVSSEVYDYDIFVAKFNPNGAHQWSQSFGDVEYDYSRGIAVDFLGNVIVVGRFGGNSELRRHRPCMFGVRYVHSKIQC